MAGLIAVAVAALMALAIGVMCARVRTILVVTTHAIVATVYSAGWLATLLPVRFVAIALLLLALAVAKVMTGDSSGSLFMLGVLAATGTIGIFSALQWDTWWSPAAGERIVRYLLLFTTAYVLGSYLRTSGQTHLLGAAHLGWSLFVAPLAAYEYFANTTLVARDDFEATITRDDRIRAVLLSEHPLVLATLMALALPVALRASTRLRQVAAASVLIAGIYATQSRGVLAVALLYTVGRLTIGTMPRVRSGGRSLIAPILMLMVVLAGIVAIAEPSIAEGNLSSKDPAQASLQYRGVLYSKVGESLVTHPLGWGPMGLPKGVYVLDSPLGPVDLSLTIDSEPVLLVLEYGVLGLAAFLFIMALSLDRALRYSDWLSDALLIAVVCSSFLAVHSWTGLGIMAFLLIGGNVARRVHRSTADDELVAPMVVARS